jgi:hypothetical protein
MSIAITTKTLLLNAVCNPATIASSTFLNIYSIRYAKAQLHSGVVGSYTGGLIDMDVTVNGEKVTLFTVDDALNRLDKHFKEEEAEYANCEDYARLAMVDQAKNCIKTIRKIFEDLMEVGVSYG